MTGKLLRPRRPLRAAPGVRIAQFRARSIKCILAVGPVQSAGARRGQGQAFTHTNYPTPFPPMLTRRLLSTISTLPTQPSQASAHHTDNYKLLQDYGNGEMLEGLAGLLHV